MTRLQLMNRMSALSAYVENPQSYLSFHGMNEEDIRIAVKNLERDVKMYIKGVLKTSSEWQDLYKDVIIDPDGWDRKNFDHSFKKELIDAQEYHKRLGMSTTQITESLVERLEEYK